MKSKQIEKFSNKKLGDVCEIFSGGTPSTKNDAYWNGDIPWLSSGETRNNFILDTERKITLSGVNNSSTRLAKKYDVVVASAGQGNTRGQVSLCLIDTYINQSVIVLRCNKKILLPLFLFYNLKSRYLELRSLSDSHSSRGSLPKNVLSIVNISFPSLQEQEYITKTLYNLDSKIQNLQNQNKILEQMAQAIFKSWFVDFDGVTEFEDSELGQIPKGWAIGKIKDIVEIFDGKRIPLSSMERISKKGNFPYYGATTIIDYIDEYIFDGTFFLLGEDGSVIHDDGTPFVQYVRGKIWVNNHAHVIQGKIPFSTEFIYLFFKNFNINPWITGTTQLKLNQTNLLSISIIIPSQMILEKFNKNMVQIFSQIIENEKSISVLTNLHDSLLPKLMSGEIRV